MKNNFNFKHLLSFGMFLLALLTFIYLICHQYNKNLPCTLAGRGRLLFSSTWSTTLWRLPFLVILQQRAKILQQIFQNSFYYSFHQIGIDFIFLNHDSNKIFVYKPSVPFQYIEPMPQTCSEHMPLPKQVRNKSVHYYPDQCNQYKNCQLPIIQPTELHIGKNSFYFFNNIKNYSVYT